MLRLHNTLTKKEESFTSLKKDFVSIYTCGPTVYDYASIGNFSAYLMADLVKRYLMFSGYEVRHVINITDVGHLTADADVAGGDKIEEAAKKEQVDPTEIVKKYTEQFMQDAHDLRIADDVYKWPKASEHIPEMLTIIKTLVEKGFAYVKPSGVYFDVSKDPNYGKLSGNTVSQLQAGARVEVHPDKKNAADFALWKLNQPNHLQQWDSEWGRGYPGWHIECSAMSMKYLGEQIDIHTGGEDNIFPHHECEIAQSESATGKQFVKIWMHKQFLTVDGQKMSKSLGNTYRLKDLTDKGFDPEDFRMLILAAHYRTGVNFTWDALKAARERRLRWKAAAALPESGSDDKNERDELVEALNNDLDTPAAFAIVDRVVKSANSSGQASEKFFTMVDQIFALDLLHKSNIPSDLLQKAADLDKAREQKEYAKADALRAEIVAKGYEVITTKEGTRLQKH